MNKKIPLNMAVAETMHNANAALGAPPEVALSDDVAATERLCMELRGFCDQYTGDRDKSRRAYLRKWIQGYDSDPWQKYCQLPEWADQVVRSGKNERRSNPEVEPGDGEKTWEKDRYVGKTDFSRFLADVTQVSVSSFENSLYDRSCRPNASTVNKLYEKMQIHIVDLRRKKRSFYWEFGRNPVGSEEDSRRDLMDRVKAVYDAADDGECMTILGLSAETIDNLHRGRDMDVSTVYRFLIVLCSREASREQGRVFHTFGYHPLQDNAADRIGVICAAHYPRMIGGLVSRMNCAELEAAAAFWGILKGQLRDLDQRKNKNPDLPKLYGIFFPVANKEVAEIPLKKQFGEGC